MGLLIVLYNSKSGNPRFCWVSSGFILRFIYETTLEPRVFCGFHLFLERFHFFLDWRFPMRILNRNHWEEPP